MDVVLGSVHEQVAAAAAGQFSSVRAAGAAMVRVGHTPAVEPCTDDALVRVVAAKATVFARMQAHQREYREVMRSALEPL